MRVTGQKKQILRIPSFLAKSCQNSHLENILYDIYLHFIGAYDEIGQWCKL